MTATTSDLDEASTWKRWAGPVVGVLLFALAAFVVSDELRHVSWRDVQAAAGTVTPLAFTLAFLALLVSYAAASTFDGLAMAAVGKTAPWRETRLTSTLAFALANAGGLGLAAAAGARYRAYQRFGFSGADVALISTGSAFVGLIGGLALVGIGAAGSLAEMAGASHLARIIALVLAFVGLKGLAAYLLAPRIGVLAHLLPNRKVRLGQIVFSAIEWAAAAMIFYAFLPPETRGPVLHYLPAFGLAGLLGAISGLPGGIGAFDAVMLAVLGPQVGTANVAGALLLYRLTYVGGPLLIAGVVSALPDAKLPALAEHRAVRAAEGVWRGAAPMVFGVLTFASGLVMLISAATPDATARLRLLTALAPEGLVDASHFLASLAGVVLLFLAFGVMGRLRRAYLAALAALIAAAVATLAKGLNYEEAVFLGVVALLLFLSRAAFYRQSSFRASPLSPGAMGGVLLALAAAAWLGFFAHQHVAYSDELWWTFVTDQTAPRFLRASVGVAALTVALIVWRLTSPTPKASATPTPAELAAAVVAFEGGEGATPDANLAFMGDKALLFSESGKSFVQYAARGGAWIAMGEPVGPRAERAAMIWAYRDLCDRHGAQPVFYAVRRDSVADFIDCGLVASKIGEVAIVELTEFGLEGSHRASLRQAYNRGQREGVTFEVAPQEQFDALESELRAISDQWLAIHHGEEKSFSLGRFDAAYLRHFPTALIRVNGVIVAFANVWRTPEGKTVSIDLMRYGTGAPKNVMDMLFVHLMLWGKENGFAEFDMGMAPLAGLDTHRLARAVTRLGALVYAEGGEVYGFEGLRAFKNKFGPRWDATYIAAPSGWMLASALGDVALLSSGGLRGLLR